MDVDTSRIHFLDDYGLRRPVVEDSDFEVTILENRLCQMMEELEKLLPRGDVYCQKDIDGMNFVYSIMVDYGDELAYIVPPLKAKQVCKNLNIFLDGVRFYKLLEEEND